MEPTSSGSSPLVRKLSTIVPFSQTETKGKSDQEFDDRVAPNSWHGHEFQVETFDEESEPRPIRVTGECSGRVYHIRVSSKEKCMEAATRIDKLARKLRAAAEAKGRFELAQQKVLRYYKSTLFQTIIAGLILTVKSALRNPFF